MDQGLERLVRPLLELVQRLTGLETTFITHIDWVSQSQEVVLALNTSSLQVAEGAVLDWSDSMCRWAFLSGKEQTADVRSDFPGSLGAGALGMQTFVALPILLGHATIGTVCAASTRAVELEPDIVEDLRLIAQAIAHQLVAAVESRASRERAERAEAMCPVDALTGLANGRAFNVRFEEELARSGRTGTPIALLVLDVDRFTSANDRYGRAGGDAVLRALGEVLREVARFNDVAARIVDDEFALLLPDTDAWGAEVAAARIAAEFCTATEELGTPCTVSIGIGSSETTDRQCLLAEADAALRSEKTPRRHADDSWWAGDGGRC